MNSLIEERMGPRGPANSDIQFDRMDHGKMLVYGVGMFSGMITVLFPLSVIKTKQMASPDVNPGFSGARDIAKHVWRTEGIRGFYRGYSTILTGAIPTRMIYLPTYEVTRTAVGGALDKLQGTLDLSATARSSLCNSIGGATASLASSAIVVPIDVVSQRLMVIDKGVSLASAAPAASTPGAAPAPAFSPIRGAGSVQPAMAASTSAPASQPAAMADGPRNGGANAGGTTRMGAPGGKGGAVRGFATGASDAARAALRPGGNVNGYTMAAHILRTEGLGGLYRGFGMSVITYTPSSAMWWGAYAVYQDLVWGSLHSAGVSVRNNDFWTITGVQAFCGMLSGCTASMITTPLDVIKTQLQVAGRTQDTSGLTTWQMAQRVYAKEGLRGFWRGAVPRVANVSIWGTCMVCTYELLKRLCVRDDDDAPADR